MKNQKKKQTLYITLSIFSFVAIALYNVRFQAEGLPILLLLLLHGCCMLLFYREMLLQEDSVTEEAEFLPISAPMEKEMAYTDDTLTELYRKNLYTETKELLARAADTLPEETHADESQKLPAEPDKTEEDAATHEAKEDAAKKQSALIPTMPPLTELDLVAAVREAMDSLSPFAEKANIHLHLSTTCDTLPIQADPHSIRILFRNIIDNSIKYMGQAGHMMINLSLLGDDIFVILKDTGNGLSAEETSHVFELNFQGSNRVSGNGLGLTQAKQIVEAFGGTIYAKSNIGSGMAIYIQLPATKRA